MKKIYALFLFGALTASFTSAGQAFNPSAIKSGSTADINLLVGEYLKPVGNALGVGLNNGWYQSAKPHKSGRFDLMILPTVVFIPTTDQSFTINNSDLQQLELVNGTSANAPTALGDNTNGPELRLKGDNTGSSNFSLPPGIGFSMMPAAMMQLNVGVYKNTDVAIRLLPTLSLPGVDEGKINLFGFGIKHDILQWLPGDKVIPIDVSLMFGYTKLDYSQKLDDPNHNDQELLLSAKGYTFRALVSKKLLFFTPYVGLGFNSSKTDINMNGTYTIYNNPNVPAATTNVTDPVAITADDAGGFIANVGFRLKFIKVLAFSADYTFGHYSSATTGFGVSIDF